MPVIPRFRTAQEPLTVGAVWKDVDDDDDDDDDDGDDDDDVDDDDNDDDDDDDDDNDESIRSAVGFLECPLMHSGHKST